MKIEETIRAWAKSRSYQAAAGGVSLLEEVRSSLQRRRDKEEIEDAFFRDYLDNFSYLEGCRLKNPQSFLIVALPRPAHTLSFSVGGKTVETILPPTYVRYHKSFSGVRDDLEAAVSAHNCQLEILSAPLKALANRLGLLLYGRNNIGYIDGLGSYFQLAGLLSDKHIGDISRLAGPEQKLLPKCLECRICAKACPTGAIDGDRILIHAEKCYTLFSESPEPIPEDLKPPSTKCLIGCMRCQQVCPENRGLLKYEEAAVSFDSEETGVFLGETWGSSRDFSSSD
jgi:epoxyqueuosine reductase